MVSMCLRTRAAKRDTVHFGYEGRTGVKYDELD